MNHASLLVALLLQAGIVIGQDKVAGILKTNQYDLRTDGRSFLIREANHASFFMLGELHGEQEIPELLYSLWPEMSRSGYRYIAAEISPWQANKFLPGNDRGAALPEGLWTNEEARFVYKISGGKKIPAIWGCDMEEISLGLLIQDIASKNQGDTVFDTIQSKISRGYNRKLAPALIDIIEKHEPRHDSKYNGISLYETLIRSLKIDSARAFPESRFKAQLLRENLMKESFIKQYEQLNGIDRAKIFFRFGRNHLHRGFDGRGISTMGNFISEFAIAEGLQTFNVAAFAAGGQCSLLGNTFDADERSDDLAFDFLTEQAAHDETIYDLRPLRIYLHTISDKDKSSIEKRLLYWADSYDAIICFKKVTPRR